MKKNIIIIATALFTIMGVVNNLNIGTLFSNEKNLSIDSLLLLNNANAECEFTTESGGCEFKCDDTENETCSWEAGLVTITCDGKEVDC